MMMLTTQRYSYIKARSNFTHGKASRKWRQGCGINNQGTSEKRKRGRNKQEEHEEKCHHKGYKNWNGVVMLTFVTSQRTNSNAKDRKFDRQLFATCHTNRALSEWAPGVTCTDSPGVTRKTINSIQFSGLYKPNNFAPRHIYFGKLSCINYLIILAEN